MAKWSRRILWFVGAVLTVLARTVGYLLSVLRPPEQFNGVVPPHQEFRVKPYGEHHDDRP